MSSSEGVILVGAKPTPNYVLATVTQFSQGVNKVVIKARGRAISKAVDTAEMVKKFFLNKVEVTSISIGSEEVGEEGNKRTVSTIEIILEKKA